jgi:hypothetical protein
MGKVGPTDTIYAKVCLPFDDYLPPLITTITQECMDKVNYFFIGRLI